MLKQIAKNIINNNETKFNGKILLVRNFEKKYDYNNNAKMILIYFEDKFNSTLIYTIYYNNLEKHKINFEDIKIFTNYNTYYLEINKTNDYNLLLYYSSKSDKVIIFGENFNDFENDFINKNKNNIYEPVILKINNGFHKIISNKFSYKLISKKNDPTIYKIKLNKIKELDDYLNSGCNYFLYTLNLKLGINQGILNKKYINEKELHYPKRTKNFINDLFLNEIGLCCPIITEQYINDLILNDKINKLSVYDKHKINTKKLLDFQQWKCFDIYMYDEYRRKHKNFTINRNALDPEFVHKYDL